MEVNGCKVLSKLDANSAEGFSTTVEKDGVTRGPFDTIQAAVECAHNWDKTPPAPPTPVPVKKPDPPTPAPKTPPAQTDGDKPTI